MLFCLSVSALSTIDLYPQRITNHARLSKLSTCSAIDYRASLAALGSLADYDYRAHIFPVLMVGNLQLRFSILRIASTLSNDMPCPE